MNKILSIFEVVFGCWHRNLSRPFTLSGWTYEVCLNCGRQFDYHRVEICSGATLRDNLVLPRKPRNISALGEAILG